MKLLDIIPKNKSGPSHKFSTYDIPRALYRLEKRIGRQRLAGSLGLGEGSIRTILHFFEKQGLIDSRPMGCKLTKKGFDLLAKLKTKIVGLKGMNGNYLTYNKSAIALYVYSANITNPVSFRDLAVREGALGATILTYKNNHYIIPKGSEGGVSIPPNLQDKFKPNFTIVLTYGANKHVLERAAWSIASALLNL